MKRFTATARSRVLSRQQQRSLYSFTEETMNLRVKEAQYAVRGQLVIRADELAKQLAAGKQLPFKEIVACNIGNPQDLGQKPLTYIRQVLAMAHCPELIDHPSASAMFPEDVRRRAREYVDAFKSTGSYTHSMGVPLVRKQVAEFIQQRDGHSADADKIFLTDGASAGVKTLIQSLVRDEKDGILTPIPQYPLYSAALTLSGGERLSYYLDEAHGWGLQISELERVFKASTKRGLHPRALVIINPGNPTGQSLPLQTIQQIIDFCRVHRLVIMADEVYQTNIYNPATPFYSFKKVLKEMGKTYDHTELVSFHSVSKGFLGECGQRGGYMELVNLQPKVVQQLYKLASISLCSNTSGQIVTGLMCKPPKLGEASFPLYQQESTGIVDSLRRRALMVSEALNKMEGVQCNSVDGALYAFPQITLPAKAVAAAQAQGYAAPDVMYCMELLEATGICVVPGSGFGQGAGTYHFRCTILPPESTMQQVLARMATFHASFMAKYK